MDIIYGPDKPKISFKQSPSGLITFQIENERVVKFKEGQENIPWRNLYSRLWALQDESEEKLTQLFRQFVEEIATLIESGAEKKFFLDYVDMCIECAPFYYNTVWDFPALIPQAWVNWIHYDPKDVQRAERAQKEPFRVDFMMKDIEISPNLIIFEIDGSSHFADRESYARHLQKDRWLRKQGWQVFRISNSEVEQYNSFIDFFEEITGRLYLPF